MTSRKLVPVPAPRSSISLFQRRPDLADAVKGFVEAATSEATKLARESDWRVFTAWCLANGIDSMPVSEENAALYIADQAQAKSVATVMRYISTINKVHELQGYTRPMSSARVKTVIKGMRRVKGVKQRQKAAFSPIMLPLSTTGGARDLRDAALLMLGVATSMRRSELCGVDIEHLTWVDEGLLVYLPRSKTDQEGHGSRKAVPRVDTDIRYCPVRAVHEWLRVLGEDRGPLFRGMTKNGRPRPTRLSERYVSDIVKRAVAAAGYDPDEFGGHSLRAGYVTLARKAGADWPAIMAQTGHRKLETVKQYSRYTENPFDETQVFKLFNATFSRHGHLSFLDDIKDLVDTIAGAAELRIVTLPPPSHDPRELERFSGGRDHRELCSSAARWLDSHHRQWSARSEYTSHGHGIADVATVDGSLYVEAGYTSAYKVTECLLDGNEILLAPYGYNGVVGFLLSPSPNCASYSKQVRDKKLAEMIESFKKLKFYSEDDE